MSTRYYLGHADRLAGYGIYGPYFTLADAVAATRGETEHPEWSANRAAVGCNTVARGMQTRDILPDGTLGPWRPVPVPLGQTGWNADGSPRMEPF